MWWELGATSIIHVGTLQYWPFLILICISNFKREVLSLKDDLFFFLIKKLSKWIQLITMKDKFKRKKNVNSIYKKYGFINNEWPNLKIKTQIKFHYLFTKMVNNLMKKRIFIYSLKNMNLVWFFIQPINLFEQFCIYAIFQMQFFLEPVSATCTAIRNSFDWFLPYNQQYH